MTEWKWMTESTQVVGLGRWFAQLHSLTKSFRMEHPHLYQHARKWTELHDGVLATDPHWIWNVALILNTLD